MNAGAADTPADETSSCSSSMRGHGCQLPTWHRGNHQALIDAHAGENGELVPAAVMSWNRRPFTLHELTS